MKLRMPSPEQALPGRTSAMPVARTHAVLGTQLAPPYPAGLELAMFGMGCFWGAERKFWQLDGVYSTAVGYAGGYTPNPTYEEVCSGRTGHAEVVRVVYDPRRTSFEALLRLFWEGHDPTLPTDRGAPHRSVIYWSSDAQRRAAETSRDLYQRALSAAGFGRITTEIAAASELHYADDADQQRLAKHPGGYGGVAGTGVGYPARTR